MHDLPHHRRHGEAGTQKDVGGEDLAGLIGEEGRDQARKTEVPRDETTLSAEQLTT